MKMKHLLLALTIGFIAMGCRNFEKGEKPLAILDDKGYVTKTFCGDVINIMKDGKFAYAVKPINLPEEYKYQNIVVSSDTIGIKVELKYQVTSEKEEVCPGFFGYKQEIKIINIKKID